MTPSVACPARGVSAHQCDDAHCDTRKSLPVKEPHMGTSRVRAHLERHEWDGAILEFPESSATVELAAAQAGTSPERIAKTLAFYDPEEPDHTILVVAAGDAKVNGGMFKRRFGGRGRMLRAEDVHPRTGYPVGGVCPFANPGSARVFLDESLRRFPTVFPAAGTATSAVELDLSDLERMSEAEGWVEVTTGWRESIDADAVPHAAQ